MKVYFGVAILVLSFFIQSEAKSQEVYRIKRAVSPVEFDGRPYEEAWNGLEYFPMTMFKPNSGEVPSERSEIMITYDDKYVWIGARLFMKDASEIAITSKKRDDQPRSPDHFAVLLDTYNDNENAMIFSPIPRAPERTILLLLTPPPWDLSI